MKSFKSTLAVLAAAVLCAPSVVQGGNMFSLHRHHGPRNDPNRDLHSEPVVSHLEWNSQIGYGQGHQSRQGGERGQFQPYADFALQEELQRQQQHQQFGAMSTNDNHEGSSSQQQLPCRDRDRVYLPDMQSFLIKAPMTYQEAVQACLACRSELVLIDVTNLDRFPESFRSLGYYADQHYWIKSWFGRDDTTNQQGTCPAAYVNSMMGCRLE
ncbi:hypothetical protein BGX31_002565, partial [Mortierella sp. GBA43]